MNTLLLDCTLRDGGYYTDWNFDTEMVNAYIQAMNVLPIDYMELGYRNNPSNEYLGKFGYCPVSVLRQIRVKCSKKLGIMLNEKSTRPEDLDVLLKPIIGLVDIVRIAIDPSNFDRAVLLARAVKAMGFEVGFNCMYMSKWMTDYPEFLTKLNVLDSFADLFCMVDSYGGVTPDEVRTITTIVRKNTKCPLGFHGHNNLQLGLINTITAINLGVDCVDATILGMGRGAGNLNVELLLTYLNAHDGFQVDFNVLGDVISVFKPLQDKYQWGTNLPYMLAGANRIPQKKVMDWVSNRAYSFNSIVRALDNQRENRADNARYPIFVKSHVNNTLIIGGGASVIEHIDSIREFILMNPDMALIFVTSRHVNYFSDLPNTHFYILVGNEAKRMKTNIKGEDFRGICILPPYPRKMGTDVPTFAVHFTNEIEKIDFTSMYEDSCTAIALQLTQELCSEFIYVVGYDGYKGNVLSEKEMELSIENRTLFSEFRLKTGKALISLTPSLYLDLTVKSIYQYL